MFSERIKLGSFPIKTSELFPPNLSVPCHFFPFMSTFPSSSKFDQLVGPFEIPYVSDQNTSTRLGTSATLKFKPVTSPELSLLHVV